MIKGKGISKGIGFGKIFILEKRDRKIQKENVENTEDEQNTKVVDDRTIGEALPKGRNAREYLPRTEEFPYNVADAKKLLEQNDITIGKLAKAMGNFPEHKLRNIFRYDNRRFTKQDFDVILKAIDDINDKKNIKI